LGSFSFREGRAVHFSTNPSTSPTLSKFPPLNARSTSVSVTSAIAPECCPRHTAVSLRLRPRNWSCKCRLPPRTRLTTLSDTQQDAGERQGAGDVRGRTCFGVDAACIVATLIEPSLVGRTGSPARFIRLGLQGGFSFYRVNVILASTNRWYQVFSWYEFAKPGCHKLPRSSGFRILPRQDGFHEADRPQPPSAPPRCAANRKIAIFKPRWAILAVGAVVCSTFTAVKCSENPGGMGQSDNAASGAAAGRPTVVLFVCTSNTCRSPMAEIIARRW